MRYNSTTMLMPDILDEQLADLIVWVHSPLVRADRSEPRRPSPSIGGLYRSHKNKADISNSVYPNGARLTCHPLAATPGLQSIHENYPTRPFHY